MVYCWNGNTTIRTWSISYGISRCVDNEISSPYPESWRKGVFGKAFSESYQEYARMRDREVQYAGGPHSHGDDNSAEICGERCDRAFERADGEQSEEKV